MTIWCQKWDDVKLHWIMIIILPHYDSETNYGTPESHARNDGNTGSLASKMNAKQAEIKATQQKMDTNQAKMAATLKLIKAPRCLKKRNEGLTK
jgi:hypothetical protein